MSTKEMETNNLKKQFQALQEDWNSYKSSIPRRRRSPLLEGQDFPNDEALEFSESSNSSTSSGEISIPSIQEPIHIVGKNLLEELEAAKSDADDDHYDTTPGLSKCSSVLIQEDDHGNVEEEEEEEEEDDDDDDYSNADDEDENNKSVNDTSCMMKIGLFFSSVSIVFIGFILIMLGFHGDGLSETNDFIVPT